MKQSFVFSGSGGQGVMSAGIMIAQTAVSAGKYATFLPEYGPEQRGGSAKCTVVVNDEEIISPLMAKCDTLITMNEQSFKKFGASVELYDGVLDWFTAINEYGKSKGVKIEHYINSSGLAEMIEGTPIAKEFKRIFIFNTSSLLSADSVRII